ncbi:tRNA (adenosine(37)-N6)-threonylcarbamoyltransferase complex ATPase subunit type 1 TsaE [Thermodesulfobacteriota bacterium]
MIALIGELGSGKTWFTKGLALGLGVGSDTVITSPSFALVNEYKGRCLFYHMDLYRLDSLSDLLYTGLEEYFFFNGSVAVVEWANRWPEILPEWSIEVKFDIIDDHKRSIIIYGRHPRAFDIIGSFKQEVAKN